MSELETRISPTGTPAHAASQRRAARSSTYRRQRDELATTRELARQIILYRTRHGLSQQQLADLVGTSHSQISRIESGRYMPAGTTLQRIARALNLNLRIILEERETVRHASGSKDQLPMPETLAAPRKTELVFGEDERAQPSDYAPGDLEFELDPAHVRPHWTRS